MCERIAGVVLGTEPDDVAQARRFVRAFDGVRHGAEFAWRAELVVSELVTNAIRHGAPPITLELACDGSGLRITVTDTDPALPSARRSARTEEGGRGLQIVTALSAACGVEVHGDHKRVWARLAPVR